MVQFGMCGCGQFIEKAVLPSLKNVTDAGVVAAFDTSIERLGRVCGEFGIDQACNSFEDLLKCDEIDAIYIASPNVMHKAQTIASAKAGKHVFCQKPLGMNVTECREMLDVCRDNGVSLGVGFCYRFGGAQCAVKQIINDGIIGEVSYLHFSFNLGGFNKETAGWRCDPKMSGGGPLMDIAPHLIDLACFLLDTTVESVIAYVDPFPNETEVETDVLALLKLANGAGVSIDTSFKRNNTHSYVAVGSNGELRASGTMPWRTEGKRVGSLVLQSGVKEQELPFSNEEHMELEMRSFCQAVDSGVVPSVPGEAGLHVQAVIDAIYESSRTEKRCEIRC